MKSALYESRDIVNVWGYLHKKYFDHPFLSDLSTNKQWLADFKILNISSTLLI